MAPTVGLTHGDVEFLEGSFLGFEKFAIFQMKSRLERIYIVFEFVSRDQEKKKNCAVRETFTRRSHGFIDFNFSKIVSGQFIRFWRAQIPSSAMVMILTGDVLIFH